MSRLLVVIGPAHAVLGLAKLDLGRLPGEVVVQRVGFTLPSPCRSTVDVLVAVSRIPVHDVQVSAGWTYLERSAKRRVSRTEA